MTSTELRLADAVATLQRTVARLEASDTACQHRALDAVQALLGPVRDDIQSLSDAVARLVELVDQLRGRLDVLEGRG